MSKSEFLEDPWGVLLGMWRRYRGTAHGQPPVSEERILLWQQGQLYKYQDWKIDQMIRDNPKAPEPLLARASKETEDSRWEDLLTTSELLCKRFPDHVAGFRNVCWALRKLKRIDEAEDIAKRTKRRFPESYIGWEAYANCATDRGDFAEAERRWRDMRAHFPDKGFSHTMHALALIKLDRLEEADEVLTSAVEAFPDNATIRREFAISAERMDDWEEAVDRWLEGRRDFESDALFHARAAIALLRLGDFEGATDIVTNAEFMFPRNAEVQKARRELDAYARDSGPHDYGEGASGA